MNKITGTAIGIVLIVLLILVYLSAFIVTETQQAVITQLGRPVGVIAGVSTFLNEETLQKSVEGYEERNNTSLYIKLGAGLYFKIPFIQDVQFFDNRILEYDSSPESITTADKKRVLVDNFARWRISDPLLFLQRVQSIPLAQSTLDDIIYSALREQLGEYEFIEIIRSSNKLLEDNQSEIPNQKLVEIQQGRTEIMNRVTEICKNTAETEYGIQILDVRIKRVDLPDENLKSVFENMSAERQRIAAQYQEEGKRDAAIIRAQTDREVKSMIAKAEQKAQVIRGEADAEAARIYAEGFVQENEAGNNETISGFQDDPEFFKFIRSLEALELGLDANTSLFLGTDNQLLRMLERPYDPVANPSVKQSNGAVPNFNTN